jgi:myo-inositol-1(or 4)-monophosphatase
MFEIAELLELTKSTAKQAGLRLTNSFTSEHKSFEYCPQLSKEIKSLADSVLDRDIIKELKKTSIPILSEESGYVGTQIDSPYQFIVDPLDGTFNFVKGLGACAISIALWKNDTPIFGVIYSIVDQQLYFGGHGIGSYSEFASISVSSVSKHSDASICTGFPVRLNLDDERVVQNFCQMVRPFSKVRMLGSAAVSLLNVAKGAADVYAENNIMIWDVAAGIAIVQGAGGYAQWSEGTVEHSLNVYASNGKIVESSLVKK